MGTVPIGPAVLNLNVGQVTLLMAAGRFAIRPEMMPAFYTWLRANYPHQVLLPADQIPTAVAEASSDLAAPLAEAMSNPQTGAHGAGARVP